MTQQRCWFPVPGINDELTETLDIIASKVETHAKCLDASPAAEQLLQEFRNALDRVQNGITDLGGASFACFPFQFSQGNRSCRGESGNRNSPVCMLCRKLHGYKWVYARRLSDEHRL